MKMDETLNIIVGKLGDEAINLKDGQLKDRYYLMIRPNGGACKCAATYTTDEIRDMLEVTK